jgi:hypothetical protein
MEWRSYSPPAPAAADPAGRLMLVDSPAGSVTPNVLPAAPALLLPMLLPVVPPGVPGAAVRLCWGDS